jgi:hypothetical protein
MSVDQRDAWVRAYLGEPGPIGILNTESQCELPTNAP